MAEAVLDLSAILAVLRREIGFERVADVIANSLVSVVNEAEVISVLIQKGEPIENARKVVRKLPYQPVDLDRRLAHRAGILWLDLKPRGLSLGDRCCLALAERERLPALTSDKRWAGLSIGVDVQLFR